MTTKAKKQKSPKFYSGETVLAFRVTTTRMVEFTVLEVIGVPSLNGKNKWYYKVNNPEFGTAILPENFFEKKRIK